MRDLMLRFADASAAARLCPEAQPGVVEVDAIGPVLTTLVPSTGVVGQVGFVPAVTALVAGFHVNLRVRDDRDLTALAPYMVVPVAPVRAWL